MQNVLVYTTSMGDKSLPLPTLKLPNHMILTLSSHINDERPTTRDNNESTCDAAEVCESLSSLDSNLQLILIVGTYLFGHFHFNYYSIHSL